MLSPFHFVVFVFSLLYTFAFSLWPQFLKNSPGVMPENRTQLAQKHKGFVKQQRNMLY
jgi:hypothetical protein